MISVIIPTYNEEAAIKATIRRTWQRDADNLISEVIVADGGSTDLTIDIARSEGVNVLVSARKGRAAQMNAGAAKATGEILYFLHADTIAPPAFTADIMNAINMGYIGGCYRLSFDYDHWFLKANAWFTRFNANAVRFGDQSLFVRKEVFQKAGGFREDLLMMEDQEIIHRIKKQGKFKVINRSVVTSARKYLDNGVFRMQGIFFRIWAMYYLGYSQQQMLVVYRKLIRKHKL
jgi:rSAM/selenodomain-associated transferase 2